MDMDSNDDSNNDNNKRTHIPAARRWELCLFRYLTVLASTFSIVLAIDLFQFAIHAVFP